MEAPGGRLSEDADGNRAATVQAGAVSAQVSTRWSDTGGQSAMLVYTNHGPTAVRIALGTLAMSAPAGEAVVMTAADVTNIDLVDAHTDNDDARVLLQRDASGTARGGLDLPSGTERRVDAQISPFSDTSAATSGNAIILRYPCRMPPAKSVSLRAGRHCYRSNRRKARRPLRHDDPRRIGHSLRPNRLATTVSYDFPCRRSLKPNRFVMAPSSNGYSCVD